MGSLVLIPVLCPANNNRHFPFLYLTVSHWPRQEATLHCFSNLVLSNCRDYLVSIILLAFHIPNGASDETHSSQVCEHG
jgi:hypothetical protein